MLDVTQNKPSELILVMADMARSEPPLTNAFVAEYARRLQGRGAALALPLTWIEQRLAESGQTIEQRVHMEGQQQAANQVSVSNSIGSLRLLDAMDWGEFVETQSGVEQTLRGDPSGSSTPKWPRRAALVIRRRCHQPRHQPRGSPLRLTGTVRPGSELICTRCSTPRYS